MPLDPKQRWALDCFYPGLIARTEELGPGTFEAKRPVITPKGEGLGLVEVHLKYALDDGMQVNLLVQLKLKPSLPGHNPAKAPDLSQWSSPYYSLDYGKKLGDTTFRFDLDRNRPAHAHIEPDVSEHWPADRTDPDTRNMDPRDFVAMVAKFRKDKIYPVKRITSKRKKP